MHVLLTNDDGPPGDDSPYFHYFVEALKKYTDWDISVALPHQQRSWIGKAHLMGHNITASYIYPGEIGEAYEGPMHTKSDSKTEEPWVLLDGTPASCANIGVTHLFKEKGPVDLVISGPNYGRNCTALYIMSSGTVGAAMEASLCGVKSIGLSYSFKQKGVHNADHITEASRLAAQLVQHLYSEWSEAVQLYTINIPLVDSLSSSTPIKYASILENSWGASYDSGEKNKDGKLTFKWNPDFAACQRSIEESEPGNDGWVVANDMISVTPLRASFKEVPGFSGELKLNSGQKLESSIPESNNSKQDCVIAIPQDNYLYPVWRDVLEKRGYNIRHDYDSNSSSNTAKLFHYCEYDDLDFDRLGKGDDKYLGCSYIYRKGLIRKHYLTNTIQFYTAKHPESSLRKAYPESYHLEVDYAEFLDDALDESYELRSEIENGSDDGLSTWILKPSMSDRAQGIRLFKTIEELQQIFDEFDEGVSTDDEDEDNNGNGVVTSQMRHFVVQRYVSNPLLLLQHQNRKFHVRTYVLAVGSLKVYVYKEMLALFAGEPFDLQAKQLDAHLTNTCFQGDKQDEGSVVSFWQLKGVDECQKQKIFDGIASVTGELFKAAATVDRINFQPLPNAFEMYGLDFLVQDDLSVKLLEVNAYPDFKQTGEELKTLIYGLFDSVAGAAIDPFFSRASKEEGDIDNLIPVLDHVPHSW